MFRDYYHGLLGLYKSPACNRSECPVHTAIFIAIDERIVRYDLSALEVEFKSHLTGAHRHESFAHHLLVLLLAK